VLHFGGGNIASVFQISIEAFGSSTHRTGDGIRRAMQLLTQTGVGNGKVVQLENWTDTKVPTLNGNGQHALPVTA